MAIDVLRHNILSLRKKNVHDSAAIVIENSTGHVLAYIGSMSDLSSAKYVDGVQAKRQAGSALKPFLYARAFDQRLITPSTRIEDSPLDIPVFSGVYRPRNYDNQFHGPVTARVALASSLNVPAVKVLNWVGVDAFVHTLKDLKFSHLQSPEFYGPSLALGSADVSLWELTNAYRVLANHGIWSPATLNPSSNFQGGESVFSEEATFLVSDILSDRESRSSTFGFENPLSTRTWSAVKTGTSKDMRDNWCIGFSDKYTVGVWVGNFSGSSMWNVTGISGAAPAWLEIMNHLHVDNISTPPKTPQNIVKKLGELYVLGTEPEFSGEHPSNRKPKITYPTLGTIFAFDPDIPLNHQAVIFKVEGGTKGLHLQLNGKEIGSALKEIAWVPKKSGIYKLVLIDSRDKIVDKTEFEVRGSSSLN